MLVIVSDLHLKDGTLGDSLSPNVFRAFVERVQTLAYRASWRTDGQYRPVESIDLILLGDVFDYELSLRWHQPVEGTDEYAHAWDSPDNPHFIAKVREITQGILETNAQTFDLMRQMSAGELIRLPAAPPRGNPDHDRASAVPVRVRIYYMVGNHDWFLRLSGNPYTDLRQQVIDRLGLANTPAPFPHDPTESQLLWETMRQHRVLARHGDIFDPWNYNAQKGRNTLALGGAVTIELLVRFILEVQQQLGDRIPPELKHRLTESTDVYPPLLTPLWIDNLFSYHTKDPAVNAQLKELWNDLVARFQKLDIVRMSNRRFRWDTFDGLNALFLVSRALPFESFKRLTDWIATKFSRSEYSFAPYARQEQAFQSHQVDFIAYGHTHVHEIVPLEADYSRGRVYVNTGSWHRFYYSTCCHTARRQFVGLAHMSGLVLYRGDERRGHPFDTWVDSTASWQRSESPRQPRNPLVG